MSTEVTDLLVDTKEIVSNLLYAIGKDSDFPTSDDLSDIGKATLNLQSAHHLLIKDEDFEIIPDYKAKYEKCIGVIKRFDPGIIGMYDL